MRKHTGLRQGIAVCLALFYLTSMMAVVLATLSDSVWPEASGTSQRTSGGLTVDFSNAEDGYIMVKGPVSKKKLKVRIALGEQTMTYDLNGQGEYEVFPLQLGSGTYQCTLYKNASGKKYAQDGKVSIQVTLSAENAPFLCPNQYVSYTAETKAVQLSEELCAGLESDREKFEAVRAYIKSGYVYDFVKAATVAGGTMPDIDGCYEKRMGICQDLAALAACMLRAQGVPTKFIIGYVGKNSYHAWNGVIIDGEEILYDPTLDLNGIAANQTYTVERFY